MAQYTQEQFWKLYDQLPQELKDALWSEETGNTITQVSEKYALDALLPDIVQLVGAVLLGLLLPENLADELEKIGVAKDSARQASREINRLVFYPVKPVLEQLHKMEIEVSAKVVTPEPPVAEAETPALPEQESKERGGGPDSYRESIE